MADSRRHALGCLDIALIVLPPRSRWKVASWSRV